jgi:hypothetical protein
MAPRTIAATSPISFHGTNSNPLLPTGAPLVAVLGAGANEALRVTETVRPRLQQLVDQPREFDRRLRALPA